MRQLCQSLSTGEIQLLDVPCPAPRPGHLLIQSTTSLISAGTERMLVEFGRANLWQKARRHPERVREVLDKIRAQGLLATVEAVRSKLAESIPLGYCNVGRVLDVGEHVAGFAVGDRVVSNGPHAEVVSAPQNLCARIPANVADEDAAFTVLGAVGLQGVRLAEPTLGESFVVTGLGLIGLLTTQLLLAHGCRVLGIDLDPRRLELAASLGAETAHGGEAVVDAARRFARGRGVDGVLITASCSSDEPMHQAANMCRQRGRIVLVGDTGLQLRRSDFYEKELQFRVSCSYGPGRYDSQYEQQGIDYPIGFVRWTEQRNFEAVLDQMSAGRLTVDALRTHAFAVEEAAGAYQTITDPEAGALGVLLKYPPSQRVRDVKVAVRRSRHSPASGRPFRVAGSAAPRVAVVGAGNFARRTLIPNLQRAGAEIVSVASRAGLSAAAAAEAHGVGEATTAVRELIQRDDVDAVAIATRHDSHASLTIESLAAGKHVFVEKPLAVTADQLGALCEAKPQEAIVMAGFNRRFAPLVTAIKAALDRESAPKSLVMTVNAGALPQDHWVHDPTAGGGRMIGEGCHFVDLLRFLVGHPVERVQALSLGEGADSISDSISATLSYADGSIGVLHYLSRGSRVFPKERLEVFCNQQTLQLDNFRRLRSFGWSGVRSARHWRRDQGHQAAAQAFVTSVAAAAPAPIPWDEQVETTDVCFDILRAARTGQTVERPLPTAPSLRRSA